MKAQDRLILIAVIGKAQGLQGQMRLNFFGDNAENLAQYPCFYGKDGRVFTIAELHMRQGKALLRLAGVESRAAAEAMAGTELFIKRSQLADLSAADEFYQEDLLGFAAFAEDGAPLGTVSGFFNFGGGDLLELSLLPRPEVVAESQAAKRPRPAKPKKELIPFSKAAVPQLDIKAARLTVNLQAAGLTPAEDEDEAAVKASGQEE